MKRIFIILTTILTINFYGQKLTGKIPVLAVLTKKEQKSLSMFPNNYTENNSKVAYFIDGKLTSSLFLSTFNQDYIDTYNGENKIKNIDGIEYSSQLYFTTKKGYKPKYISIDEIRKKYTKNQSLPCVYFIDYSPIKIIEKNIFLDENNIFEVCCHLYNNDYDNLKINVVEIFTKTKQNIEKSKELILD